MPNSCTTSWLLFPPQTQEVQFDEKWSFVGKKEKHVAPAEPRAAEQGDQWDHVAFDPEHRLVLQVIVGKRTEEHTQQLVEEVRTRLEGRIPRLMTSDEYPAYAQAIQDVYGQEQTPPRTGRPGRPAGPQTILPPELHYATVHKTREQNRVIDVATRVVFGTEVGIQDALHASTASTTVNTAYVERHNATDRHRNARKTRKTYRFSKDWTVHEAMTHFSMYSYNFCWPVRTLRLKNGAGVWQARTPAQAAGLADHVWSIREWATLPAVQR